MVTPTDQAVFQLLRESLVSYPSEETPACSDWAAVYDEMKSHTVEALALHWLKAHPLPDAQLQAVWIKRCSMQQANWIRVMVGQDRLLKLLEANHIPCVIIKGAAAAAAYPHPSLRAAHDVDLLVKRSDFARAAEIMEQHGYISTENPASSPELATHYHWGYRKDGIYFELHRRLSSIAESDEAFISLFEEGIDNREMKRIESFIFPVLPAPLHGLVLIMHINAHTVDGSNLRQLTDWMMFAEKNDITPMLPLLKKTGMKKLADCITAICQKHLGLRPIVDITAQKSCDALIGYMMDNGNLGRKGEAQTKGARLYARTKSPIQFLSIMHKHGLTWWGAAKKHPWLRPFAWIYGICRVLRFMLKNRITPGRIKKSQQLGSAYSKLYHDLDINEIVTLRK